MQVIMKDHWLQTFALTNKSVLKLYTLYYYIISVT